MGRSTYRVDKESLLQIFDLLKEPNRVQCSKQLLPGVLLGCGKYLGEHEPLQWRFGTIIDQSDLSPIVLFSLQLQAGLKAVGIEP